MLMPGTPSFCMSASSGSAGSSPSRPVCGPSMAAMKVSAVVCALTTVSASSTAKSDVIRELRILLVYVGAGLQSRPPAAQSAVRRGGTLVPPASFRSFPTRRPEGARLEQRVDVVPRRADVRILARISDESRANRIQDHITNHSINGFAFTNVCGHETRAARDVQRATVAFHHSPVFCFHRFTSRRQSEDSSRPTT